MALVLGTNCGFVTTAPTGDPGDWSVAYDNYAYAISDTTPTGTVKITEIGWYCLSATEEANYEVGIYEDSSNRPGNAVAIAHTNAKGTTAGWKRVTVDWTVSANTVYWIAVQLDDTATATNGRRINPAVGGSTMAYKSSATTLADPWDGGNGGVDYTYAIYAVYETAAAGTNMKINIGDVWKDVSEMKINVGDAWKAVTQVKQNVGDTWKTVFG